MHDINDDIIKGAIGEQILDQVKLILEVVSDQPTRSEFNELRADVEQLQQNMNVVKVAVTDHSKHLSRHDQALGRFRRKAA